MDFQPDALHRDEYINRVNRVIDYIDENINEDLTLARLSHVANFSEYHFHRVFKGITGEPLNRYIQRVRVEKAAAQLLFNPNKKITEIAYDSGFSSSQFFSRVFRQYFDVNANNWRLAKTTGKILIPEPKKPVLADKVLYPYSYDYMKMNQSSKFIQSIKLTDLPPISMAYTREIGVFTEYSEIYSRMSTKLSRWSDFHRLNNGGTGLIAVFRDHPVITEKSRLRITLCLPIDEDINAAGDIGICKIRGGKYAVGRFELAEDELEDAWKSMYCEWLPQSGFQLGDEPPVEFFLSYPGRHPTNKFIVDICIPVKLL